MSLGILFFDRFRASNSPLVHSALYSFSFLDTAPNKTDGMSDLVS
jgi:hypothetical protein